MEDRKFSYLISIILKPKPGNLRFSEIKVQGTGLDASTFNKLLDVVDGLIDKITSELITDNCIKIVCSSTRVIPKDSQVILCQIISEVGDEIFVDPSNNGIIGIPKHIYPLVAKTIRTSKYENTEINKEFYLEFSN